MIGLPSLRAFDHQQSARIWLAATPVDMSPLNELHLVAGKGWR